MATVTEPLATATLSASFQTVSDLEMLGIINDLGGDVDEIPTNVIAKRFFGSAALNDSKVHCHTAIGSRMAWMKKIDLVVKGKGKSTWKLSPLGAQLLRGRMPKWQLTAIKDIDDEQGLHLADNVGKTMLDSGPSFPAMERQLRHFVLMRKKG